MVETTLYPIDAIKTRLQVKMCSSVSDFACLQCNGRLIRPHNLLQATCYFKLNAQHSRMPLSDGPLYIVLPALDAMSEASTNICFQYGETTKKCIPISNFE